MYGLQTPIDYYIVLPNYLPIASHFQNLKRKEKRTRSPLSVKDRTPSNSVPHHYQSNPPHEVKSITSKKENFDANGREMQSP